MNTSDFSFLHRKNKWGMTVLLIVLCAVFAPGFSLSAFIPRLLTALPLMILLLLGYVGPVCTIACTAILTVYGGLFFGLAGVLGTLLFIVPVLIASPLCIRNKLGFWISSGICAGVMLASEYAVMLLIASIARTDAVTAVSRLFADTFNSNPMLSENLIALMIQSGVVSVGNVQGEALSAAQKTRVLQVLLQSIDQLMRLEVPMQIATGALSAGVLGQALLRRSMLREGIAVEYPPLRTWMIPKGWGRVLTITAAALYVLSLISKGTSAMFYVFSGVFEQAFAMQGIAAISYAGHKNGKGKTWQGVIFILGYFILTIPAIVIGAADQAFDFTHRRQEIEEREKRESYDPKAEGHQ